MYKEQIKVIARRGLNPFMNQVYFYEGAYYYAGQFTVVLIPL